MDIFDNFRAVTLCILELSMLVMKTASHLGSSYKQRILGECFFDIKFTRQGFENAC